MKKEMATRCELAMMGKVVPVNSNDEVQEMTEYIVKTLKGDIEESRGVVDIVRESINRFQENTVKYLVTNTVMGMPCITYLLDSGIEDEEDENYYPAPFTEDYGSGYPSAFCYVFNLDCDWCSEFGDCFFEMKEDGFYHRAS